MLKWTNRLLSPVSCSSARVRFSHEEQEVTFMTHDFIDTYVVFGFILVTVFIVLAECIDRYKSHRWSGVLNA